MALKIISQFSVLDNLELVEVIDIKLLHKLLNSNLIKDVQEDDWDERKQLMAYSKLYKNKQIKVKYERKKKYDLGRVFPVKSLGLCSIRREIRHTLCNDIYVDIDVVNCHPVLLEQICIKHNKRCINLSKYVNSRDEILDKFINMYGCPKDIAKQLFIQILYGGSFKDWIAKHKLNDKIDINDDNDLISFVINFENELKNINNDFSLDNPDLVKKIKKNKDYNIYGTLLSYILQEYENRILETIYKHCVENKYIVNNVAVLCFDGIMIEKKYFKPELLEQLMKRIETDTNFKVILKVKSMDEGYMDIVDENITENDIENSYEKVKNEFELTNFKIMHPIAFAEITKNKTLIIRNKSDFMTAFQNVLMTEYDEKKNRNVETSFMWKWFDDPKIRTYQKIDFLPSGIVPEGVYNTFSEFAGSHLEINKTDIQNSLILEHLNNICGNDPKVYEYVIHWFARLLKNPEKKALTTLLFKSNEGAGKDTFLDWFGKYMLGKDYYFNSVDVESIFGRFNSCLDSKILVVVAESSGQYNFNKKDSIKNAITAENNNIERKGKEIYQQKNSIGYVFLSNNENPLAVPKNERRIVAIECNNTICGNTEYFNLLHDEIKSGSYNGALYKYFMELDSDNFNFNDRPKTDLYKQMQESQTPIMISFFMDYLILKYKNIIEFKANDLFDKFKTYLTDCNFKMEYTSTKFGSTLIKYTDFVSKQRTATHMKYIIDITKMYSFLVDKKFIDPIPDF